MIQAYHVIFSAYGFWLPNDPRGSWSDFVASWQIFRYGKVIPADTRISRAKIKHDIQKRLQAKTALQYPPVIFEGVQARAIGRGFNTAVEASGYRILACAIMPDHIHAVIRRHSQTVERMVGHLKGRASTRLEEEGLHPFMTYRRRNGELPSPWAEGRWKVFLDGSADIERAVRYVENNPPREGLSRQGWSFLEDRIYSGIER